MENQIARFETWQAAQDFMNQHGLIGVPSTTSRGGYICLTFIDNNPYAVNQDGVTATFLPEW